MKNVIIVVPESAVMQAIADPEYCLSAVNNFVVEKGQQPLFKVRLAGLKREIKLNDGKYSVFTDLLLKEADKCDLIIVPALNGNMDEALSANKKIVVWLKEQYNSGAEIASLCLGAFLLASTGLLDGKKCSTHWCFVNKFREMFPAVNICEGNIVTEECRLYSSGGASSYWNLLLHLVEKYAGRDTAIMTAKYFAIDIERNSQAAFALFKGQKNHNDEAVIKAQDFIETKVAERFTVDDLASRIGVGRRSFERRFRKATGNSVLEYIQRVRMEAAKRSFETSRQNINEVMFNIGYTDPKAFRETFKKITGITPNDYRNKYNKS
jgi:transcriptional regulator GlxA family with amidase domain